MKQLLLLSVLGILAASCAHPITATSNKVGDLKGKACARNILFIIPLGLDNSIHSAAKNAGVSEISTVDSETFYSGIYNQNCTIVHGNK